MFSDSILYLSSIFLMFGLLGYFYLKFIDKDENQNKINPDYLTGLKYLLNEESDKAIDLFSNIIDIDEDTIQTHLALGVLFRRQGKFDKAIKLHENIILDDFNNKTNERLLYSLFNLVDNDNKYLLINSLNPINEMNFNLDDLKSRSKNCLFAKIESPDDELMFAIILKRFSDRQITIDKKLIDFIIKRIDRSYGKISDFIYKIDELSLKKKRPIDFKTIKEILKV